MCFTNLAKLKAIEIKLRGVHWIVICRGNHRGLLVPSMWKSVS